MITAAFATLDDFMAEITAMRTQIAEGQVRWMKTRKPAQKEAVSFNVYCFATALRMGEVIDQLLEFGGIAGEDYEGRGGATSQGSDKAEEWRLRLVAACHDAGLELLEGAKYEVY